MNFLSIDYLEFEKDSYHKLTFSTDEIDVIFYSGNPIVDFYEYINYIRKNHPNEETIYSSSVGHFCDDCNYTFRHINSTTGEFYSDEEVSKWSRGKEYDPKYDTETMVICSNRIKTRKGYDKYIRNFYKTHPKVEPIIVPNTRAEDYAKFLANIIKNKEMV